MRMYFFSVRHVVRNKVYVYLTDNPLEDMSVILCMCIKYDTYAGLRTRHSMCIVCYPHTQNYMSVILRM